MATTKESQEKSLDRLMRDLQSEPTLRHMKDYPGVSVEQLNEHIAEVGPLVNPVFGEQHGFFTHDEDERFLPYRNVVDGCPIVAPVIATKLGNWSKWFRHRGSIALSRGAFITGTEVRTPDVLFEPRHYRRMSTQSTWTHGGDPYAPIFVVEIDELSGDGSQLSALDRKMRQEYFTHGVQLGWLIDPRPGCQKMFEYKIGADGQVYCVDNNTWRDLDGGDVLPGFRLRSVDLDMALDSGAQVLSEEEEDLTCPLRQCGQRFTRLGLLVAHVEWHRAAKERTKYLAERSAQRHTELQEE